MVDLTFELVVAVKLYGQEAVINQLSAEAAVVKVVAESATVVLSKLLKSVPVAETEAGVELEHQMLSVVQLAVVLQEESSVRVEFGTDSDLAAFGFFVHSI